MTAALTLTPNAHKQRELAELLLHGSCSLADMAAALGVSANDAAHIMRRLRANGLPVTIVEDIDPEPRYRILYPKGRVCAARGCGTLLRRSNPSDRCEAHGGGVLHLRVAPAAPRTPKPVPQPRPQPQPVARLSGPDLRAERERRRLSVRRLAALANMSPAYLSRLERGQRRLRDDVGDRLEAVLEAAPVFVELDWRVLRLQAGLSLREVARRGGVDAAVLSRVERGERRATREVGERLAKTFGTSVVWR